MIVVFSFFPSGTASALSFSRQEQGVRGRGTQVARGKGPQRCGGIFLITVLFVCHFHSYCLYLSSAAKTRRYAATRDRGGGTGQWDGGATGERSGANRVGFILSGPPTIPNWSPTQILGGPIFSTRLGSLKSTFVFFSDCMSQIYRF